LVAGAEFAKQYVLFGMNDKQCVADPAAAV